VDIGRGSDARRSDGVAGCAGSFETGPEVGDVMVE